MIRVVIVDDQELIRSGFEMILSSEDDIEVAATVADGSEALDAVRRHRPNVVLMDIRMPLLNGIEATRQIIADRDDGDDFPRILILTTFDLDDYVFEAIQAGASGFLLKDTPPDTLVEGVRIVARGDSLLSPSVTRRVVERFASGPMARVADTPELDELTGREREVLLCLAKGNSNQEIADTLFVSETTVKTHVSRVLTKLGVRDRVQAVILAYESGLVTPGL